MNFNADHIDLPIKEIIPELQEKLKKENTVIVNAPPGAGKSTLLPLMLMDEPWLEGQKILMLEPRRLAARTISARMAELINEEVGESVGYRVRFDNRVGSNTRLEVLTEGILTRIIQNNNDLNGVGLVIFDEFHERSIHADTALAFCREIQQILRPDLRIIIMSATLDTPQLTTLLNAPAIKSTGRQHPVAVHYTEDADMMMLQEMTAQLVGKVAKNHDGDILVFMPGEGEIKKCAALLENRLIDFSIHPLYGKLPLLKQKSAILPNKDGKRKVVIATSIAETSLTIEGINTVVDSGFGRTSRFDPRSGLSRLETLRISKDSANQRAGRAGRLGPGDCYRMWTKATQDRLKENRTPEILEADLGNLVLDMANWGIKDVYELTWITHPARGAVEQASNLLHQLEALDNNIITAHGKRMQQLPCHPRIAHMLIMAEEDGLIPLAADIAALLEERDPLQKEEGIDINLRIEALRRFRNNNGKGKIFGRIAKVAEQYRNMFSVNVDDGPVDPYQTGLLIAYAYPDRIAHARPGNNAQFQLANGRLAMAGHKDDLAHEAWLSVAHLDARDGMGKIFLASPLNPRDLAPLVKEKEVVTWDTRKGGLVASTDLRIGNIILSSKPIQHPDRELVLKSLLEVLAKEGENLLDFDDEVTQWQNRVMSLRVWNDDNNWPDVSTENLLRTMDQWLTPYLQEVRKNEDLKKLDLKSILHHSLPYDQQQQLAQLAPERIEVPSGSFIRLSYQDDASSPVLAVRLQEVFGMEDTPMINRGKNKIIMHLLSPGFKLVQITEDLRSFWDNAYFDVKKDIKGRYPKHYWPEDPWSAEAVRGVKKKK